MHIRIERRFRRSLNQELKERKKLRLLDVISIAAIALVCAEAIDLQGYSYFFRLVFFGATTAFAYLLIALAFAQLRAKAQPFDHTLIIRQAGITLKDNLRQHTQEHAWQDFERVRISDDAFEFKRKKSERGEVYMLNRSKLSSDEDTFLGKRLVEL